MEALSSNIHHKTWGYEVWIANKEEYCGKLLYLRPGQGGSLHYHLLKDETFYLQSGRVAIRLRDKNGNDSVQILMPGQSLHIPRGQMHQIISGMETASELFEFSTEHFEEDSYRVEKFDPWITETTVGITKRIIPKSWSVLMAFSAYCQEHPEERFWQALRNFATVGAVYIRCD